jgi:phytanoyl-CoA hydroxylase
MVGAALRQVIEGEIQVSQCHHNCVMTKYPGYSSATLWHQDIRYWSFDRPELVSAWFALKHENRRNGALKVIPGSHRIEVDRGRFDRDLFLRPDLTANRDLIHQAVEVELNPGDVLLFHCRLFHAAGKNLTDEVKLSPVFTYHAEDNRPIPGTRSSQYPSVACLPQAGAGEGHLS